jgi:SAM-dependent methyltransferase/methyltransferase-like protein
VSAYDETPWGGEPCAPSHPDNLGAIARVFGLDSAIASRCRVLELGCASGANLIPMAAALPHSTFIGVDLSTEQIGAAKREAAALGLANITFHAADLAALPPGLEPFDYVIAQGVFSWVQPAVEEALLRAVAATLTDDGVALVSYAALPGAYPRMALRELMRWKVRGVKAAQERVETARRFAEQVAAETPTRAPMGAALRRLVGELGGMSDAHVLHEYLAEVSQPLTLTDFVGRAEPHGLRYLGDAQFHTMFGGHLDGAVLDALRDGAESQLAFEQTLDFVGYRPFRTSLLCRSERVLDHNLRFERLGGLFVSCSARPTGSESAQFSFRGRSGEEFGTDAVLTGAALTRLCSAYPLPIAFDALCASQAEREALGTELLAAFASGQVQLGTTDRGIASADTERPRAFASARAATRGSAINLWHQRVPVEPLPLRLLPLLDGTRTLEELVAALPPTSRAEVDEALASLAAAALLSR